jgi:uncharacterized protein (DUF736 family)
MSDTEREKNIGALWLKEGRKGKYMSGVVTVNGVEQRIVVFKNHYKQEDKHPDYRIFMSKPREERFGQPASDAVPF